MRARPRDDCCTDRLHARSPADSIAALRSSGRCALLDCASLRMRGSVGAHAANAPPFAADFPFRSCDGLICIDVVARRRAGAHADARYRQRAFDADRRCRAESSAGRCNPRSATARPCRASVSAASIASRSAACRRRRRSMCSIARCSASTSRRSTARSPTISSRIACSRSTIRITACVSRTSSRRRRPTSAKAPGSLRLITFGEHGPPVVVGSPFTVNGKTVHAQIDTVFTGTMLIYDSALDTLGPAQGRRTGALPLYRRRREPARRALGQHRLRQRTGLLGGAHTLYFVGEGKQSRCISRMACSKRRSATRCSRTASSRLISTR